MSTTVQFSPQTQLSQLAGLDPEVLKSGFGKAGASWNYQEIVAFTWSVRIYNVNHPDEMTKLPELLSERRFIVNAMRFVPENGQKSYLAKRLVEIIARGDNNNGLFDDPVTQQHFPNLLFGSRARTQFSAMKNGYMEVFKEISCLAEIVY
jgi:hypothetical protein